jgi:putative membrane protein
VKRFVLGAIAIAALAYPQASYSQSSAAAPPAVAPGPAPPANPTPAEVMPSHAGPGASAANDQIAAAPDAGFARTAAESGAAEIRVAQLAVQRAEAKAVRTFARRMIADHTKLANELTRIAKRKGITLPADLNGQDRATLADLTMRTDGAFDDAYIRSQINAHEIAVSVFQQEADHGTDADLKAFAAASLPTLKDHLQMAKDTGKGGQ